MKEMGEGQNFLWRSCRTGHNLLHALSNVCFYCAISKATLTLHYTLLGYDSDHSSTFWRLASGAPSPAAGLSMGGLPSARRVPLTNAAPWDAMCLLVRWRPALGLGPQNSSGLGRNRATPEAKALLVADCTFLKFACGKKIETEWLEN